MSAYSTAVESELPVSHPLDIEEQHEAEQWLLRGMWGRSAVGIVGGAPKCCKTWLALDMAVSVASNTAALGRFPADDPGPALVYLAEDALPLVRRRIESICRHRQIDLSTLELNVITSPVLRLDLETDQLRLRRTIERLRPRMLLLDPLIRLHRLDENSAAEMSGLLGSIRDLQRSFDVAIVLVHHASKRHRSEPGQALRGSGDLHAFGDSNAYLSRAGAHVVLTLEHRSAKAPDPMTLELESGDEGSVHLIIRASGNDEIHSTVPALEDAIRALLQPAEAPITRQALRERLRVNNHRLGQALAQLERDGYVVRSADGWHGASRSPAAAATVTT